jgi:hypothetical protein
MIRRSSKKDSRVARLLTIGNCRIQRIAGLQLSLA